APRRIVMWRTITRVYGALVSATGFEVRCSPPNSQFATNETPWLTSRNADVASTAPTFGPAPGETKASGTTSIPGAANVGSAPASGVPTSIGSTTHTKIPWTNQKTP